MDRGDLKIRLKFHPHESGSAGSERTGAVAQGGTARCHTWSAAAGPSAPAASAPEPAADPDAGLHFVKSPIVGTYYGSPSPGSSAFVSPGDHVEKGQVICIVEAMKLMNEIESDVSGEIVRCLVTNGQAIEFGQPLFAIRPV